MKGFNAALLGFGLSVIASLSSPIFASPLTADDIKMLNTKAGCMACHQGNALHAEKSVKKKSKAVQ